MVIKDKKKDETLVWYVISDTIYNTIDLKHRPLKFELIYDGTLKCSLVDHRKL